MISLILFIGVCLSFLALILNRKRSPNNSPFYMGDRDELWIDYCDICGKRHELPHCVRCKDCAKPYSPNFICNDCGRCYDHCKCTPWEGE